MSGIFQHHAKNVRTRFPLSSDKAHSDEYAAEKSVGIRQGARIFYRAWSHNHPTGGQKQMYRHVDILNSAGFEAYIFHHEDGFRVSWFDNDTRVVGLTAFKSLYRSGDILVLPEDVGQAIQLMPARDIRFTQIAS
ncbi:MAG TPA: hypothetical protein VNZ53_02970 [Steroidobacteraceae bacterium]|nr:hypothetical protein [Steroidobacteraceae bacterium]